MVPMIPSHGGPRLDATLAGELTYRIALCATVAREAEVEREERESAMILVLLYKGPF